MDGPPLLPGAPTAVTTTDLDFHLTGWDGGAAALYGWNRDEVLGLLVHEVCRPRWHVGPAAAKLARLGQYEGEAVATHRDGSARFVRIEVSRESRPGGEDLLVVRHWDLTRDRRAEIVARAQQAGLAALAAGDARDALAIACDAVTEAVPGAAAVVLRHESRTGRLELEASADLDEADHEALVAVELGSRTDPARVFAHRTATCVQLHDAAGGPVGCLAVLPEPHRRLVGEELELLDQLGPLLVVGLAAKEPAGALDVLTGLAGWPTFDARLRGALGGDAAGGTQVGVVAVHLDRLHAINDELGLPAGDGVLRAVASRLTRTAPHEALVCRLGGDRFGILVEALGRGGLDQLADSILESVRQPIRIGDGSVVVTASVGAVAAAPPMSPDSALGQAIAAAKAARDAGGGRVVTASGCPAGARTASLAAALDAALHHGDLLVHYQPLIDLETTETIAVEALLRWTDPVRGAVPPGDFIPVAEETGLIVPLGAWVLEQACADAVAWGDDGPAVSVNVSARQLLGGRIVGQVRSALERTGLAPQRLCLELTETALAQPDAAGILTELRRMGAQIALDDFGTGFSSLDHVARFPIDELKIDARFVLAAPENPAAEAVVRAVAALGSSLGLRTVAEGIEDQTHLDLLRSSGCEVGQGYLIARPMPLEALLAWLPDGPVGIGEATAHRSAARPVPVETEVVDPAAVLDGAADVTVVLDPSGAITYASGAAWRALGWDPAAQVGRSAVELVHPDEVDDVLCALSDTARDLGSARPFDVTIRAADGTWRTMEACSTNHANDRRIRGVVVSLRDVTGQRALAGTVGGIGDPAARILDLMGVGVWTVDRQGRTLATNTAMARLATTTIDDLRRSFVDDVLDLDVPSLARTGPPGGRHDGWRAIEDTTLRRRDGTETAVRVTITELYETGGELEGHVLCVEDVGDLVAGAAASRARERCLRAVLGRASTGLGLIGADGRIRSANPALAAALARPPEALDGATLAEQVHPGDRAVVAAALAGCATASGEVRLQCRTWGPRGSQRSVELVLRSIGSAARGEQVLVEARDITPELALADSLETQRSLADALVDVAGSLVVVMDAGGRIERWNQACEQIVGWSITDLGDRPFWEVLIPQEGRRAARRAFEVLGTGEHRLGENEILTRDGHRRRVSWHYAPLHARDGRWTHLVATGIDITDQRDAEQDRDRFFALSSDLFAVLDPEGTVLRANPALSSVAGPAIGGLRGWCLLDVVHPDDAAPLGRALRSAEAVEPVDARVRSGDGRWTWMSWRLVSDSISGVTYAAAHDITAVRAERERLEAAALTDPLTGLLNRAGLHTHTAARMREGHGPLTLLLCDLDGFKSVNDTWGHAAGDEVLRVVAARLEALAMGLDGLACRFGGDEFVLVVPAPGDERAVIESAGSVAADVRRAVARPVQVSDDLTVTLAAALGEAVIVRDGGLAAAVAAADAELYAQKRARTVPCPLLSEGVTAPCSGAQCQADAFERSQSTA